MPYASARDVRIHYESHGTAGPPVVLLQGLGLSSRFWFDAPRELAARERAPYRVLAPDNRGTGRSDKPRGAYRMSELADDVAAVLDHAGVESAYVAGISLGGMIAQHVALRHPRRVRGLVLLATTPGLPHGRLPHPRTLATLLSIPFYARRTSPRPLYGLVLPDRHLDRAAELMKEWPAAIREDPIAVRGFFGQLCAAFTHSTGFRLGEVGCPAVVVTGAEDALIPPRNSDFLAKRIPRATLRVLPEVGHGIPILDRGALGRALDEVRGLCGEQG